MQTDGYLNEPYTPMTEYTKKICPDLNATSKAEAKCYLRTLITGLAN